MTTNTTLVRGLDSIRFLCAFWVVMGHAGTPPLTTGIDKTTAAGWLVNGAYNNLVSGPAAVTVFFVISGFCIHFPHTQNNTIPSTQSYFARRYIRICLPMLGAIFLARYVLNIPLDLFDKTILWSLLAELIYYSIYPILLWLRRSVTSWTVMTCLSFLVALGVASTNPGAGDYPSYGPGLNWLLGLPCWLIGCKLAETVAVAPENPSAPPIWRWRFAILLLSAACSAARFHSPLGYPWTLNAFSIAVAFWLYREILYYRHNPPPALTEWAGTWSYSLYLTHPLAMKAYDLLPVANLGYVLNWSSKIAFILTIAYLFALALEFPAHILARRTSRLLQVQRTPPEPAPAGSGN